MLDGMQYVIVICSIRVRETRRGNLETLSTLGTHDTRRRQTKHISTTQHRKLKRWAICTPLKIRKWTQVLANCQQPLLLKSHLPCNSYILYIVKLDKGLVNLLKWFLTTWYLLFKCLLHLALQKSKLLFVVSLIYPLLIIYGYNQNYMKDIPTKYYIY
jgi:hypothetical protein